MAKIILLSILAVFIFIFSLPVTAQDKNDAKKLIEFINKEDDRLVRDLGLTDMQRKKLKQIGSKYYPQLHSIQENNLSEMNRKIFKENPDREKRHTIVRNYTNRMRALQETILAKQTKELNEVYTPDQLKKIRVYQLRRMELGRKMYPLSTGKK